MVDFVELPMGFSLRRLPVPESWFGRSLADLGLLGRHRLNLVQIMRQTDPASPGKEGKKRDAAAAATLDKMPLPFGDTVLQEGDLMDVIGPDEVLEELARGRLAVD